MYDLTDHLANFLLFDKFSSLSPEVTCKSYKRDFSHLNEQALVNEIGAVDWCETFDPAKDSSALFPLFYSKL